MSNFTLLRISVLALACAFCATAPAVADVPKTVNVVAGDLTDALETLARQCGVDVIYPSSQLNGLRTEGVDGVLQTKEAFQRLLKGTPLVVKEEGGSILIMLPAKAGSAQTDATNLRLAQNSSSSATTGTAQKSAASSADKADSPVVEEIVVTAQKRTERLQDVPMSITALSGEGLRAAGVENGQDLTIVTPGLTVGGYSSLGYPMIRGVGALQGGVSFDPTTAVYFDGVYSPRFNVLMSDLFDVERVEVLKGPQVVLYGRNATAGAVHVIAKDPGTKFGGEAGVQIGDYGHVRADAAADIPLSDKLFLRAAVMQVKNDGYMENILNSKDRPGEEDLLASRLVLKYLPREGVDLTLRGYLYEEKGGRNILKAADPVALGSAYDLKNEPWKVASNQINSEPARYSGLSFTVNWDLGWANLTSITAYSRSEFGPLNYDLDTIETTLVNIGVEGQPGLGLTEDSKLITQEAYVSGERGHASWLVGASYLQEDAENGGADEFYAPGAVFFFPLALKTDAYAVYGQLTYTFSDALHLTAGLRQSWETKELGRTLAGPAPLPYQYDKADWHSFTPSFSVQYDLSKDMMFYATVATGFKSGGAGGGVFTLPFPPFLNPEKIINYEVGAKGGWLDNRLRLDVSAFQYRYTDLQVTRSDLLTGVTIWENAGKVEGKGLEIALQANPVNALEINAGLALLDSKFVDFQSDTGNLAGNRPSFAPTVAVNLGTAYAVPVRDLGDLTFRLDYYHQSRMYFGPTNDPSQGPYGLFNARTTFTLADGTWSLGAYGKNLTDERIRVQGFNFGATQVFGYAPPRTYGVEIRHRF